jgi:hypothetical protein
MSEMTRELDQFTCLTADLEMVAGMIFLPEERNDAYFAPRCKLFDGVKNTDDQ